MYSSATWPAEFDLTPTAWRSPCGQCVLLGLWSQQQQQETEQRFVFLSFPKGQRSVSGTKVHIHVYLFDFLVQSLDDSYM